MTKSAVITARVAPETLAMVDKIAAQRGHSRAWFVTQVVEQAAQREAHLMALLQEGIADIEAGRVVDHDVVMADLDAMIAKHKARCEE
jgi:predicted transcriptional regulator